MLSLIVCFRWLDGSPCIFIATHQKLSQFSAQAECSDFHSVPFKNNEKENDSNSL